MQLGQLRLKPPAPLLGCLSAFPPGFCPRPQPPRPKGLTSQPASFRVPLGRPCTLPPQWPKRCARSLIAQRTTGSAARPRAAVHWSLVESLLTSRHSAHGVGAEGRERDESKGGERECETERESWRAADRNCPRPLAFTAHCIDPLGTWHLAIRAVPPQARSTARAVQPEPPPPGSHPGKRWDAETAALSSSR